MTSPPLGLQDLQTHVLNLESGEEGEGGHEIVYQSNQAAASSTQQQQQETNILVLDGGGDGGGDAVAYNNQQFLANRPGEQQGDYYQQKLNNNKGELPPRPIRPNQQQVHFGLMSTNNNRSGSKPPRGPSSASSTTSSASSSSYHQQQQHQQQQYHHPDFSSSDDNNSNYQNDSRASSAGGAGGGGTSEEGKKIQLMAMELKQIYYELGVLRPDFPTLESDRKAKWLVLASHIIAFYQTRSPVMEPEEWHKMRMRAKQLERELTRSRQRRSLTVQACREIEQREQGLKDLHRVVVAADQALYSFTASHKKLSRHSAPNLAADADSVARNVNKCTMDVLRILVDWARCVGSHVILRHDPEEFENVNNNNNNSGRSNNNQENNNNNDESNHQHPHQHHSTTSFLFTEDLSDSSSSDEEEEETHHHEEYDDDDEGGGGNNKTKKVSPTRSEKEYRKEFKNQSYEKLCELFSYRGVPYLEKIRQDSAFVHQTASLQLILHPDVLNSFRKFQHVSQNHQQNMDISQQSQSQSQQQQIDASPALSRISATSPSPAMSSSSSSSSGATRHTLPNSSNTNNNNATPAAKAKLRHLTRGRLPSEFPLSNSPSSFSPQTHTHNNNNNNNSASLASAAAALVPRSSVKNAGAGETIMRIFSTNYVPSNSLVRQKNSQHQPQNQQHGGGKSQCDSHHIHDSHAESSSEHVCCAFLDDLEQQEIQEHEEQVFGGAGGTRSNENSQSPSRSRHDKSNNNNNNRKRNNNSNNSSGSKRKRPSSASGRPGSAGTSRSSGSQESVSPLFFGQEKEAALEMKRREEDAISKKTRKDRLQQERDKRRGKLYSGGKNRSGSSNSFSSVKTDNTYQTFVKKDPRELYLEFKERFGNEEFRNSKNKKKANNNKSTNSFYEGEEGEEDEGRHVEFGNDKKKPSSSHVVRKVREAVQHAADAKPLSPIPHAALPRVASHADVNKCITSVAGFGVVLRGNIGNEFLAMRQQNSSSTHAHHPSHSHSHEEEEPTWSPSNHSNQLQRPHSADDATTITTSASSGQNTPPAVGSTTPPPPPSSSSQQQQQQQQQQYPFERTFSSPPSSSAKKKRVLSAGSLGSGGLSGVSGASGASASSPASATPNRGTQSLAPADEVVFRAPGSTTRSFSFFDPVGGSGGGDDNETEKNSRIENEGGDYNQDDETTILVKRRVDRDGLHFVGKASDAPSAVRSKALKQTASFALGLMSENSAKRANNNNNNNSSLFYSPTSSSSATAAAAAAAAGGGSITSPSAYSPMSRISAAGSPPPPSTSLLAQITHKRHNSPPATRMHQIVAAEQREKREYERAKHDAAMMRMKHPAFRRNAYSSRHARNAKGPAEYWSSVLVFFVLVKRGSMRWLKNARRRLAARKIRAWYFRISRARSVIRLISDEAWRALERVRAKHPAWTASLHLRSTFDHAFALAHMRAYYIQKAFYKYVLRKKFYLTILRVVAGLKIQKFIRTQFQIVYKMRQSIRRKSCARKCQRFFRMFRVWSNPLLRMPLTRGEQEQVAVYRRRMLNSATLVYKTKIAAKSVYDKQKDVLTYVPHSPKGFIDAYKLEFEFSTGITERLRQMRLHLDGRASRQAAVLVRLIQRFVEAQKAMHRFREIHLHHVVDRLYQAKVLRRRLRPTGLIKSFLCGYSSVRVVAARRIAVHATRVLQRVARHFPEMRKKFSSAAREAHEVQEITQRFAIATERERAAIMIQRWLRGTLGRRSAVRQSPKFISSASVKLKLAQQRDAWQSDQERNYAALKVQTHWRMFACWRVYKKAQRAWHFIKAEWSDMWDLMLPCLHIQQKFRSILQRNRELAKHRQRRAQNDAAQVIQAVWHASKEEDEL